ncbi:MAG: response regulator transcription factor [Erysipelotrichaceae bacterium]|nr:response regulator transcription factor [Erysipelotrichaceae bacterium]
MNQVSYKKVFIVEDERSIAQSICQILSQWNLQSKIIENFDKVCDEFLSYHPDIVLMDISLPYFDGYYWCNKIRQLSNVPIIFISSISDNINIVMAMNMGADDFIVKPFDNSILVAKILALLRRSYDYSVGLQKLEYEGLTINIDSNTVYYKDKIIELSKNEFRILLILIQNKGKVVSREKLMNQLWKTDIFIDENTLTVNVNRLRKKLSNQGIGDLIKTKFGVGYIVE